jgi:excisionase family DNA binding protein
MDQKSAYVCAERYEETVMSKDLTMVPVDNLPEICTPEEVANFLRIDVRTVKKLCRNGELDHFRPTPNKIRIPRDKIEEYKDRCLKRTKEFISTIGKTEIAGKSESLLAENVSDMQLALAAVKMQKKALLKS